MHPILSLKKRLYRLRSRPIICTRRGARLELFPRNWIDNRLLAGAPYEDRQIARCIELARDHDIDMFLDIGANIGLYSVLLALATEIGEMHAFEPVTRNGDQMEINLRLNRLDGRVRVQIPLTQALAAFAEEFEDSSADLVVAALILNSKLRGPGLVATLSALATATREEVDMRRRIEEGRKSLRRTALIIVGATATFAGAMAVFSRDYVAPYSSPLGQAMLAVVLSVFAGGLMWIRSAANLRPPERFLVGVDQVDSVFAGGVTR